jgi:hypothetical protein
MLAIVCAHSGADADWMTSRLEPYYVSPHLQRET